MYQFQLHKLLRQSMAVHGVTLDRESDELFYARAIANVDEIHGLFMLLYSHHPQGEAHFRYLVNTLTKAHTERGQKLRQRDWEKAQQEAAWFTSNSLAGISLYVDRFCGNLAGLPEKLSYLQNLGVNLLHLMPLFKSPEGESDGGYAVSDFREVDERFGTLDDLVQLQEEMAGRHMYLMLDIVFNHTSHRHEWAEKAKAGDKRYQDFFYMYDDRTIPDRFEQNMPDIFPETAPGSFTYVPECGKWVMAVFHHYQWDLNYTNPAVFVAMLDTVLFYASLGVDVLRIDAPAFIWKELGTTCQNLPKAHTILQLLRQCVQVAAPGMALLGEAIVAPREIMHYFGDGAAKGKECDFAYNATQMALQWDALATGDTRIMMAAQDVLLQKPAGTSWITYTRCHDDIGLGFEDASIRQAGFDPFAHRKFLQQYYSGQLSYSPATGALFSVHPKTGDARISGSLASLCGLEKAVNEKDEAAVDLAIRKILLMQAHSFFIGGLPMLFYGDEVGYTNDYSYLADEGKKYDNRWLHRPLIDWEKNRRAGQEGTIENRLFSGVQRLLAIRKNLPVVADRNNHRWLLQDSRQLAVFVRTAHGQRPLYCLFNFSDRPVQLFWTSLVEKGLEQTTFFDHWQEENIKVEEEHAVLVLAPFQFCLLEQ